MRVLHLAAVDAEGGAARAAFRLHSSLLARGIDSAMLVKKKVSTCDTVQPAPLSQPEEDYLWNLLEIYYLALNRTELSNTYYSLGYPGLDLSEHPLVRQADVLHLHWVANYLSPPSLARLQALGKPLVWTLHDQRPFTGGCHFSAGCAGYERDCAACPQLRDDPLHVPAANLADMRVLVSGREVQVVTPSRWLADCARRSAAFRNSPLHTIPYAVDTQLFRPYPQAQARSELGLPPAGFHLLLGADFGSEKRKGFRELVVALKVCWAQPAFRQQAGRGELHLLAFGRPAAELGQLPMPVRCLGYIQSDETLAKIYSAANLFLVPSLEDNLPNTMLEAMSCGTPVLAFAIGGMPDAITAGKTGWLAPAGDTGAMARHLASLAAQPGQCALAGQAARSLMQEQFSPGRIADAYRQLYQGLLDSNRAMVPGTVGPGALAQCVRQLWSDHVLGPQFGALYPRLALEALGRFSKRRKRATAAEALDCARLVQALQAALADPGRAAEPTRREEFTRLKAALARGEEARLARVAERKRRKTARREWLRALFRVGFK